MAEMNFGGVIETVVTSKEFSLEKAREVLKNEKGRGRRMGAGKDALLH